MDETRVVELVDDHTLEYDLRPDSFEVIPAEVEDVREVEAALAEMEA
jgi:hypothetical protein